QSTVAASGPAESRLKASGKLPSAGTRAAVGLKPVRPQKLAGMRMEPLVSVPRAATAMPSATETAAPDDEPPGMRRLSRSQGLLGVPKCGFRPRLENANSVRLVCPIRMAPARGRRSTTVALYSAAGALRRKAAPALVGWPATSNKSLMEIGSPSSAERLRPA